MTDSSPSNPATTCPHGSLRRACEVCERDAEIDRLRALNAELLAMVERFAGECAVCDGEGRIGVQSIDGPFDDFPCTACASIRALIARAKDAL